jgi:hypothetical protein
VGLIRLSMSLYGPYQALKGALMGLIRPSMGSYVPHKFSRGPYVPYKAFNGQS